MSGPGRGRLRAMEEQMRIVGRRMRRAVHERAVSLDPSLGRVAYGVLDRVISEGPSRQADLGCVLDADKSAISRAVQQLLDLGLVERAADARDGRVQWVAPTELGRARMAEVADRARARYAARLEGWSDDDLDTLIRLMTRYNEDLERDLP